MPAGPGEENYYNEEKVKYDGNISAPSSPILFQPMFVWNDAEPTFQGTGFFVSSSDKQIAAVTSSHFIDTEGSRLKKAYWLNISEERFEPVASFARIWGKLGNGGSDFPMDLRYDYLIMPPENAVPDSCVLELDDRVRLKRHEGVWFPNKDPQSPAGYTLVDGMVTETQENYHAVILKDHVEFQSQSGSPVISKLTGKVIGTLSRAGYTEKNKPVMYLAPSHSIKHAVDGDAKLTDLSEAVGKK
ncbi:peptidase domain-containing protein [Desulfonema magnum]|uniref:Peptidase domain-containing protein n=2 Tax=Desulfonema magnum TaxID=45655 RepID=A0A975BWQ8_9BACT|nr:peptidase domain-containing protein [Desulfonema magnum]